MALLYPHTMDASGASHSEYVIELSLTFLVVTSIVFGYFKVGRRNNILDVVDLETVGFDERVFDFPADANCSHRSSVKVTDYGWMYRPRPSTSSEARTFI